MPKEIILLEDVEGIGVEGEIVAVAEGFARNFLIPKGKATLVTALAQKQLEQKAAARDARLAAMRVEADNVKDAIDKASCTIKVKTGDDGKLFGSVKLADILKALEGLGITLTKSQVKLADPIKSLGVYELPVKLHSEVTTVLKVWVVEE